MNVERHRDGNRSNYSAGRRVNVCVQQELVHFDAALGSHAVVRVGRRWHMKETKRRAILKRGTARNLAEIAQVLGVDITNLDKDDPTLRRYIQKPSACRHTMNLRVLTLDDWIAIDSALAERRRGSLKKTAIARARARGYRSQFIGDDERGK